MGMPGMTELIIILVIVLVIFGPGKLSLVGRSLGSAISEFKDSVKGKDDKQDPPKVSSNDEPQA